MTGLVERLREGAGHIPADIQSAEQAMAAAADEIERLERLTALPRSLGRRTPMWIAAMLFRLASKNERLRAENNGIHDDLEAHRDEIERLRALARALLDNDPDDMAADGVTVLDVWRKEARKVLRQKEAEEK